MANPRIKVAKMCAAAAAGSEIVPCSETTVFPGNGSFQINSIMNSIRYLFVLPILTLTIGAQTTPQLPDRPAAAITNYKDAWLPVVGTDNNAAVVVSGGNPVTLGKNAGIVLTVGDRYADGYVTVKDVFTSDVPVTNDAQTAATMANEMKPTSVTLEATLTSDIDIPDAYAFLITYPPTKTPDAAPMLAVVAHTIGDLKAGVAAHLSAVLPKLDQEEGKGWSILVFDAGRQVRSSTMGEVLPGYFDRIEAASLKKRIADRIEKRVDAPIAVFRQMPLGLPDAVKTKYHGTTLKVEIRVSIEGRVISARPVGLADPDLWELRSKQFRQISFISSHLTVGTLKGAS